MRKRIFAAFVCLCMLMALVPAMAYAGNTVNTSGLCEHHTQHDDACGYSEATAEVPCNHEHTEDCYTLVTNCVHEHTAECYSEESTEPICGHVCSEESGCITKTLDCKHEHDEACGYVLATEGTPCTFVCEICNAQTAEEAKCICETKCTEGEINADCPVCSAEGAELDKVCVGIAPMLPVTALAAGEDAPATLYVGNQTISTVLDSYWTTNDSGELTEYTAGGEDWNVKYEPSTATLTLKEATIDGGTFNNSVPYGAGIYALCSHNQSVSLTIELIGENTITGHYGIYVNASQEGTIGTDASLLIKNGDDNGESDSLKVTGTGSYGICAISGTGNASLNIENAAVTSSTNAYNCAGVSVQFGSDATSSPNLSLVVNGGSLTASGGTSSDGIQFYVGSSSADGTTTSLTVTDNAIVDARTGGISNNYSTDIQIGADSSASSGGIVFDGSSSTVYGSVTLDKSLTINQGETLTIGKDASLTVPEGTTLTNNGTVTTEEGGTLTGNITNAPPKIKTESLPSGTVGTEYSQTLTADGDPTNWSVTSGSLPTGLSLSADGKISGTPTTADTYIFTVTATNDSGSDSKEFTISIKEETKYSLTVNLNGGNGIATDGQYTKGTVINIDAGTKSGYRFAGWTSSNGGTFADASGAKTTFTMPAKDTTITANWKKKSSGGSVFFWDLNFDTNGGSKIDTITEWEYSTIDLDEYVPEKEGYKFVGWYTDEDLTKEIDEVYLTQDITVYAKWEKIGEEVPEETEEVEETEETETISFTDVKESDWFYDAVSYAVENGLMSGMSEDVFAPNTPLTREMLAVVLYNVEGQPESAEANTFTDVKGNMWYTEAILWANANGIVAGYDNGAYGVGDLITREQFATILYRYAQFKGYDTTQGGMAVREFSDYEEISDYAKTALAWAVNAGIMHGMGDGTLAPQGQATRAEAATMLMQFCEQVVN